MHAVEFYTTIRNGMIEVPAEYRRQLANRVRVILLAEEERDSGANLIDRLLETPSPIRGFQPLIREEIYGR